MTGREQLAVPNRLVVAWQVVVVSPRCQVAVMVAERTAVPLRFSVPVTVVVTPLRGARGEKEVAVV